MKVTASPSSLPPQKFPASLEGHRAHGRVSPCIASAPQDRPALEIVSQAAGQHSRGGPVSSGISSSPLFSSFQRFIASSTDSQIFPAGCPRLAFCREHDRAKPPSDTPWGREEGAPSPLRGDGAVPRMMGYHHLSITMTVGVQLWFAAPPTVYIVGLTSTEPHCLTVCSP